MSTRAKNTPIRIKLFTYFLFIPKTGAIENNGIIIVPIKAVREVVKTMATKKRISKILVGFFNIDLECRFKKIIEKHKRSSSENVPVPT